MSVARHAAAARLIVAREQADARERKAEAARRRAEERKRSAQRMLTEAAGPLIAAHGGHASVAVEDLTTGAYASYGGATTYDTASIVKVDILATLLYQAQGGDDGSLGDEDRELATAMITESDNDAASALFDEIGGAAGLDTANHVFGLRDTTADADDRWGLTRTSAADQVRLLRQVFTSSSVLTARSRDYIQDLMRRVDQAQRWGVPAAGDPGTTSGVKNGWLPNPGLWVINSIGQVTRDGHILLIAVLSDDNATESGGISLVENLARKSAAAVMR